MKFKKIMLVALVLLAVLTIGAVSASEDANATAAEIDGGNLDIEVPANDEILTSENTETVSDDGNYSGAIIVYDGKVYDNKNDGETRVANYHVPEGADGNVLITVEDEDWSLDVPISDLDYDDGVYYLVPDSFSPLDYGTYNMTLAYAEDGKILMSKSTTLTFKSSTELDEKYNVTMSADFPDEIYYGMEGRVDVNVYAESIDCPYDPYGKVILYLNGEQIGYDYAQYASFYVEFEEFGEYNFTAVFKGDDYFYPLEKSFNYNLTNSMYRITAEEQTGFQRSVFNVYSPVLEPTNIVITINGKKYNVFADPDGMDEYYCNASELNFGVNTINIYYPGDEEFGEYSADANITVTSYIYCEGSEVWGDPIEFSLALPKDATGTLGVYVIDYDTEENPFIEIGSAVLKDGEAVVVITDLPVGEAEVYANFTGSLEVDGRWFYLTIRPSVEIPKAIIAGEDAYITVKTSNDSNGRIVVNYRNGDVEDDDYDYELLASADVVNGEAKVSLSGLKQGQYDLECIFYYNKDSEYEYSTNWEKLYVLDKYDINMNISDLRENVLVNDEYVYVEFDLPAYADGNVTAYVDGKKVKTEYISEYYHYLNFNATGLSLGEHTLLLNFTSETQGTSSASGKFKIVPALIRIPDKLTINQKDYVSANAISVVVNDDSKGTLTILIDNKAYLTKAIDAKADEEVQYYFPLSDVARGMHDVVVTYVDDKFGSASANNTVNFGYKISLYGEGIYGEDNIIYVDIPSDLGNGDLTITVDGKKIEYVRNSSQFTVNLSKLSIGNHTVIAKYSGDDFYPADEFNMTLEVLPEIIGLDESMLVGSDEGIYLILPEDAKGKLNITVEKEDDEMSWEYVLIGSKLVSFENGKAYYSLAGLEVGSYRVTAQYAGDDYDVESDRFYFNVNSIDWGKYYITIGKNKTITFISRFDDPGQLRVVLSRIVDDRKDWDAPVNVYETLHLDIVDGKATHTFTSLPVGRYHIFLAEEFVGGGLKGYQGGEYFYVEPTFIEATASQYNLGSIDPLVLDMPGDANGTATVKIYANYSKSKPDVYATFDITINGAASIDLNSIIKDAGDYGVAVDYNGNYGKFETSSSSFIVKEVVKADSNLSATAGQIKVGEVAVVNISINENVTGIVTVNGEKVAITKGKGTAEIPDLALGAHDITVSFAGDSKFTPSNVTVTVTVTTDPKIVAKDAKVQYTAGKYYSVTVYGADGKVAPKGTQVIFTLAGKQVAKTTTDDNGVAKFKVTQAPVTNAKIVAKALGVSVTKKLTITHAATLSTVTVKKSAKKITLKVTVKVNGKAVKNKVVKFKFNNKLVKTKKALKTNSKGVATVVVPTNYYKNLKVGKTVTYQVTYLKDTVKKTAKVKA